MASEGKKTPKKTPKSKSPLAPVIGKLAKQRLFTEKMLEDIKTSYETLKTLELDTDKVNAAKYAVAQYYMWVNAMAEMHSAMDNDPMIDAIKKDPAATVEALTMLYSDSVTPQTPLPSNFDDDEVEITVKVKKSDLNKKK